jgi:hypothetical protein
MSPHSGFQKAVHRFHHLAVPIAILGLVGLDTALSYCGNSVEIESKWVDEGQKDVAVGIYIKNTEPLRGVLLPLEIRSIHVGSFIRRSLDVRPESRFMNWAGDDPPVTAELYFPYKTQSAHGIHCTTDSLGRVWRWLEYDSLPDFMGEEALLYFFMNASHEIRHLMPGDDGESGAGTPSISLVFDVTDVGGAFIIDTTCTAPANHLTFVGRHDQAVDVQFRPSIVLIGCNAECHGDPQCDGSCNIIDLVRSIDVAFKGAPPAIDPDPRCPVENTDVNCDMVTDVIDIVKMINVQYRSASILDQFCAACEHIPRSGNPKEDVRTPYFRNNGT